MEGSQTVGEDQIDALLFAGFVGFAIGLFVGALIEATRSRRMSEKGIPWHT